MAKKTTLPVSTITGEQVKGFVKAHLTPTDAQGNPAPDQNLTDSQRAWLTVDEITDVVKIKNSQSGITKAAIVKAVTELVREGILKQRMRKPQYVSEYTTVQ